MTREVREAESERVAVGVRDLRGRQVRLLAPGDVARDLRVVGADARRRRGVGGVPGRVGGRRRCRESFDAPAREKPAELVCARAVTVVVSNPPATLGPSTQGLRRSVG